MSGLGRKASDEMRAEPHISKTKKLPGVLPVFEGMAMILGESILPPKFAASTP